LENWPITWLVNDKAKNQHAKTRALAMLRGACGDAYPDVTTGRMSCL